MLMFPRLAGIGTRLSFGFIAAVLGTASVLMLGWAFWAWLAIELGEIAASAIIGAVLALGSAVCMAISRRYRPRLPAVDPRAAMFTAFLDGMNRGRGGRY